MKAVVAVPPVLDFYFTPSRASALGAVSVDELLKERGIETVLLNFPTLCAKPAKLELPPELTHLRDFIITGEHGPVSFFSNYKRFGPDFSGCAATIAAESPEILFISCFAWAYAEETVSLAAAVKALRPEIIITAGGSGVSVNPDYFEKAEPIDFVLTGEAEKVLPAFLEEQFGTGGGKAAREAPSFQINRTGYSERKNIQYYSAILTRGCPKSCKFCSNHLVHGREFRKTPAEEVERKIRLLPGDANIHINFEDDNLLFAKEYFVGILRMIRSRFPNASFSAENGLDYTLLDDVLLEELIEFGFRSFNLSMASTSQAMLRSQNRPADSDRLTAILHTLRKKKTASVTYFICGLEGETPGAVVDNLTYLHHLPTLTGISLFYPVPGLPICTQDFNSLPPRLCAGSSAWPWTGSLATSQLLTAFRLARLSNLIKTSQGLVGSSFPAPACPEAELLDIILSTGRLHTIKSRRIIEVHGMDNEMVTAFLAGI
ncbi:MAG: radical SAM protein [Spirochaetales bacterium]|nr:radical SAM protein [Spirochaetales bacterium]